MLICFGFLSRSWAEYVRRKIENTTTYAKKVHGLSSHTQNTTNWVFTFKPNSSLNNIFTSIEALNLVIKI